MDTADWSAVDSTHTAHGTANRRELFYRTPDTDVYSPFQNGTDIIIPLNRFPSIGRRIKPSDEYTPISNKSLTTVGVNKSVFIIS